MLLLEEPELFPERPLLELPELLELGRLTVPLLLLELLELGRVVVLVFVLGRVVLPLLPEVLVLGRLTVPLLLLELLELGRVVAPLPLEVVLELLLPVVVAPLVLMLPGVLLPLGLTTVAPEFPLLGFTGSGALYPGVGFSG